MDKYTARRTYSFWLEIAFGTKMANYTARSSFPVGRLNAFGAKLAKYTAPDAFSLWGEMHLSPQVNSHLGPEMHLAPQSHFQFGLNRIRRENGQVYLAARIFVWGVEMRSVQTWPNIPRQMHFHFGTKCIWRRCAFSFGPEDAFGAKMANPSKRS